MLITDWWHPPWCVFCVAARCGGQRSGGGDGSQQRWSLSDPGERSSQEEDGLHAHERLLQVLTQCNLRSDWRRESSFSVRLLIKLNQNNHPGLISLIWDGSYTTHCTLSSGLFTVALLYLHAVVPTLCSRSPFTWRRSLWMERSWWRSENSIW